MGLRQRRWAAKKRLQLRRLLGMKCASCGSRDYRRLEFDCIKPLGDNHGKKEWSWRMSIYYQQYRLGNLQLLCGQRIGSCHGKKSAKEQSE